MATASVAQPKSILDDSSTPLKILPGPNSETQLTNNIKVQGLSADNSNYNVLQDARKKINKIIRLLDENKKHTDGFEVLVKDLTNINTVINKSGDADFKIIIEAIDNFDAKIQSIKNDVFNETSRDDIKEIVTELRNKIKNIYIDTETNQSAKDKDGRAFYTKDNTLSVNVSDESQAQRLAEYFNKCEQSEVFYILKHKELQNAIKLIHIISKYKDDALASLAQILDMIRDYTNVSTSFNRIPASVPINSSVQINLPKNFIKNIITLVDKQTNMDEKIHNFMNSVSRDSQYFKKTIKDPLSSKRESGDLSSSSAAPPAAGTVAKPPSTTSSAKGTSGGNVKPTPQADNETAETPQGTAIKNLLDDNQKNKDKAVRFVNLWQNQRPFVKEILNEDAMKLIREKFRPEDPDETEKLEEFQSKVQAFIDTIDDGDKFTKIIGDPYKREYVQILTLLKYIKEPLRKRQNASSGSSPQHAKGGSRKLTKKRNTTTQRKRTHRKGLKRKGTKKH